MKTSAIILLAALCAAAASAQTTPKASTASPKSAAAKSSASQTTAKSSTATAKTATSTAANAPWIKLPPGVPAVAHGPVKIPFSMRYEDIAVGTGPEGEAGKLWHVKYTGWRAADGIKFDSWDDHKMPVMGPDGKPELDADGKPKMGNPEPIAFPQGMGRLIPGFDYGLNGMRVGGKRRLFIPWQMAYGTHDIPDRPDHPGIPAKSDLIFDVELVDVTDMPQSPHPMMPPPAGSAPGSAMPHPGAGSQPGAQPAPPAASTAKPAQPATSTPAPPTHVQVQPQ